MGSSCKHRAPLSDLKLKLCVDGLTATHYNTSWRRKWQQKQKHSVRIFSSTDLCQRESADAGVASLLLGCTVSKCAGLSLRPIVVGSASYNLIYITCCFLSFVGHRVCVCVRERARVRLNVVARWAQSVASALATPQPKLSFIKQRL